MAADALLLQTYIILITTTLQPSSAAPVANTSDFNAGLSVPRDSSSLVGFVGDPDQRGTYTLVISCLLTLILCVWSALHLNVPHPHDTIWYRFWVNTRWILTGVNGARLES